MAATHPVLLRIADHARRAAADLLSLTPTATASPTDPSLTHQPGDRVVDLVTGQEGIIYAGQRHTDLVRAAQPKVD